MIENYFKGKRVTVMGLGLLGRGVGDASYIAEAGASEVVVTDLKTEEELAESVAQLQSYENITFVLGEHRYEDFENKDLILVSADVHYQSPYLAHARKAGIRLTQSAALFAEISGIPIIGVTGTRGKSTVTHIIHHVLSIVTGEEVLLGGNIRGTSNLQLLKQVRDHSICVMELDSWQLQAWGWAERSPDIAVFTNFMPDHLNYYQKEGMTTEDAMSAYFADKANIFSYQDEYGVFITTPGVLEQAKMYAGQLGITLGQEIVLVDDSLVPEDALLSLPGKHNRLNVALALEALKALSLTEEEIFTALASFKGVEGRLQYCGVVGQVGIYNDNNATTPAATIAGIKALKESRIDSLVVILGGADKKLNPKELVDIIKTDCIHVVLLPGTGTNIVKEKMKECEFPESMYTEVHSVAEALPVAIEKAFPGSAILFSPAFASFGLFKNEYERNDEFMRVFHSLQDEEIV